MAAVSVAAATEAEAPLEVVAAMVEERAAGHKAVAEMLASVVAVLATAGVMAEEVTAAA